MKIIFCTTMFYDVEADIKVSKNPRPVSGHKFQSNVLDGLLQNNADISVINIPRIRRFPDYKKVIVRKKKFTFQNKTVGINIGFLNLYGLNYITQYFAVKRELRKIIKSQNEGIVLMTFNTYIPQTFAILKAGKKSKIKTCNIIGDINGERYGLPIPFKGVKKALLELYTDIQFKKAQAFDCYVLHTEKMAEALHIQDKPHVLMECPLYYEKIATMNLAKSEEKLIFYAGAISKEYGIDHLLNAFSFIKDSGYRLILAGKGTMDHKVEEYCKKNRRASFLGFVSPSVIAGYQSKASALVNPRTSKYNFVKYSKNMESIASGTPFVAHKLECIPREYDPYIIYPKSESDEDLAEALVNACELTKEEKIRKGLAGNEFIVKYKNPRVLTERILDLFDRVAGE